MSGLADGSAVDLRIASPSAPRFAETILGVRDVEPAPDQWQEFFAETEAKILCASFQDDRQAVLAFLNERRALLKTFEELKKDGTIPPGFQRLNQSVQPDPFVASVRTRS